MDYASSIHALVRAAGDAEQPVGLEVPSGGSPPLVTIFGEALAGKIAAAGYPGGAELPMAAEWLSIYPIGELDARQAGYRTDAISGAASPGWNEGRTVFADWGADPVTIGEDGAISYARHGQGSWTHTRIAAALPDFFALLAAWLRYALVERRGELTDDDGELLPEVREAVPGILPAAIAPGDRDAAAAFLLGEL